MKITKFFSMAVLMLTLFICAAPGTRVYCAEPFDDVPENHWAYADINSLRDMGVTNGTGGNNFGLGKNVSNRQFAALLESLITNGLDMDLSLNTNSIAAMASGITETSADIPATIESMIIMSLNALGYGSLAEQIDAGSYSGYIDIARNFGIINESGNILFAPGETAAMEQAATREQSAALLMRIYESLSQTPEINGFYAIRSSSQMELINYMDYVSFGWSRLELRDGNLMLNSSSANNNEYRVPDGFETPYGTARGSGKKVLLMVACEDIYMDDGKPVSARIVTDPAMRAKCVELLVSAVNGLPTKSKNIVFDGITLDLENMKGNEARQGYSLLLSELKKELDKTSKLLHVAVHPVRKTGQEYFDGYDYAEINKFADKIILMAHDYNAKKLTDEDRQIGFNITPLAPINEVYYALQAICEQADRNKILLQINFDTAQFKSDSSKVIINDRPYRPDYDTLVKRMQIGAEQNYSQRYESPYITFQSSEDSMTNIVWHENERSVAAKIKLARMFGIAGVSVWRLGNVPAYSDNDVLMNVAGMLKDIKSLQK